MPPTDSRRWRLPFGVAGLAVLCAWTAQHAPGLTAGPDFGVFWTAGRAVSHGENPYAAVLALGTGYPLYYPGPTALLLAPLGLLSFHAAWLVFAALSGLAYGLAGERYGRGLLAGCLSAAFFQEMAEGQWLPLLTAAAILPALSPLLIAKPSFGLALGTAYPRRWAVVGAVILTALSLLLLPSWPTDWLTSLRTSNHVAPVLRPFGWLLLLGLLRWRTPEGRLLGMLALIPQTAAMGSALPLFLVCRSRWEGYALAALTYVAAFTQAALYPTAGQTIQASTAERWPVLLLCCYLPALALTLRPHPLWSTSLPVPPVSARRSSPPS